MYGFKKSSSNLLKDKGMDIQTLAKRFEKKHMTMLLSDNDRDVKIAKLYAEHGSFPAAMLAACCSYLEAHGVIETLAEGFACYGDAAKYVRRNEDAKAKEALLYAAREAPQWLSWCSYDSRFYDHEFSERQSKWEFKFNSEDPNQFLSLGNFLIYLALQESVKSGDIEGASTMTVAVTQSAKLFDEVQKEVMENKAEKVTCREKRGN
jgi:hypothetical protein